MKANQLHDQTKTLKMQCANARRQISELNRLCLQSTGADYDIVLTQRENLYNKMKSISSTLEQLKGGEINGSQSSCLSSSQEQIAPTVRSNSNCIIINTKWKNLGN